MAEGMEFGDNTRATLITRGLAEMSRLGVAMGGDPLHVRRAGRDGRPDRHVLVEAEPQQHRRAARSAEGETIEEILAAMNMVAEGVKSSPSVLDLAVRYGVEMPITEQVVAVCHEGRSCARSARGADVAHQQERTGLTTRDHDRSDRAYVARLGRAVGCDRAVGRATPPRTGSSPPTIAGTSRPTSRPCASSGSRAPP